ncbi:hypothetical protein FH972_023504 [Carpinus fangiana]|uniref:Uncharacterized protein n=1 Tax=Carpinus fangiana TaxID=176857 RepID=A0A5N6KVM0_9ROSI|nr:hypothetical protein FH972_023504 [Carpinus fangiana]
MAVARIASLAQAITAFLVFALGVVIIGLQENAINRVATISFNNAYTPARNQTASDASQPADPMFEVKLLGEGTDLQSSHAVVAAGAIALVCGFIGLGACLARVTSQLSTTRVQAPPRRSAGPYLTAFLGAAAFIAALVVFAYATAKTNNGDSIPIPPGLYIPQAGRNLTSGRPFSAANDAYYNTFGGGIIGGAYPANYRSSGFLLHYYTLEGYTCQARNFALNRNSHGLDTVCMLSMAARWILIPLFLVALVMTATGIYMIRSAPVVTHDSAPAKIPAPTIMRMQHEKNFQKTLKESGSVQHPPPRPQAPQIKKMQKPGREMK